MLNLRCTDYAEMPTSTVFPYFVRILVGNTGIRFARLKYGNRIAKNTEIRSLKITM